MDVCKLRSSIDNLAIEIKQLKEVREKQIKELQSICKHEGIIYKTPYKHLHYTGCLHALGICSICGYEEEGSHWGDKFKTLPNDEMRTVLLDRDTFYKQRL